MTQDEIIKMATEAGLCYESNGFVDWIDAGPSLHEMTLFAQLVAADAAAKERAECLKICEEQAQTNYWEGADVCAEDIRARGNR